MARGGGMDSVTDRDTGTENAKHVGGGEKSCLLTNIVASPLSATLSASLYPSWCWSVSWTYCTYNWGRQRAALYNNMRAAPRYTPSTHAEKTYVGTAVAVRVGVECAVPVWLPVGVRDISVGTAVTECVAGADDAGVVVA